MKRRFWELTEKDAEKVLNTVMYYSALELTRSPILADSLTGIFSRFSGSLSRQMPFLPMSGIISAMTSHTGSDRYHEIELGISIPKRDGRKESVSAAFAWTRSR